MLITLFLAFLAFECVVGAKLPTSPPPEASAVPTTTPVFKNECKDPKLNDCPPESTCVDQFYGFSCQCKPGFLDKSPDKENPGRVCVADSGATPTSGGPQENEGTEAPTTAATTKKARRTKGSKSTGKTEPVKDDITKAPIDELARDSVSPKPKHKSRHNKTTTTEKPKEEQQQPPEEDNEATKAALRETFSFFDTSSDGQINLAELKAATKALNQNLSNKAISQMLATADQNSDGVVSFSEFQALMRARTSS